MTKVYTVWQDGLNTHIQNANCTKKRKMEILKKDHWFSNFKTAKAKAVQYLNERGIDAQSLKLGKSKIVYLSQPF